MDKPTRSRRRALSALLAAAAASLSLVFASPAQAASASFIPTADTWVNSGSPAQDNGSAMRLQANGSPQQFALMKFAVTGIPADATGVTATLALTAPASQTSGVVEIHAVGSTWDENTTWNTRPAPGALLDSGTIATATTTVFDVPVSANGTVSFAMTKAAAGGSFVGSRENTAANQPKLSVSWTAGGGTVNAAPSVSAGADQAVTLPASANLNGTVTDDGQPAGSSVTSTWSKVSGPGTVTFGNASAVDTTAAFSAAGTYVLRLTASDGALSSSDDVQVVANAAQTNTAPAVNAGPDRSVTLPASASLDGTVTDDGLPSGTVTQSWSKVSGPGTVTFGSPNAQDTTASFSAAGSYVLRLTATDGALSSSDDVAVAVAAAPVGGGSTPYPSGSLLYQPLPASAPVSAGQAQFQSFLHSAEPVDFWKVRGAGTGVAMNYSIVHPNECADPDVKLFTIVSTGNTPSQEHLKTSGFHARTSTMQAIQQNSDSPGIFVDECGTSARPDGLSVWAANLLYDGTTVLKSGGDGTITAGSFAHGTNGLDSRAPSSDAGAGENIVSRGRIPETMLITDAEVRAGLAGANGGTAGHVVEIFFVETSSPAGFQEPMVGAESGKAGCGSSTIICAEGQYVRIDPNVNLAARPGCTGAALVVARTMQRYGGYLGDNSGSGSGIKMEQLSTYASPNMLDPCMNLSDLQIIQKGYVPPHT